MYVCPVGVDHTAPAIMGENYFSFFWFMWWSEIFILYHLSFMPKVTAKSIFFREVKGMATVGHMMSQITKNRAVITDPVSKVIYTQFKQVRS